MKQEGGKKKSKRTQREEMRHVGGGELAILNRVLREAFADIGAKT